MPQPGNPPSARPVVTIAPVRVPSAVDQPQWLVRLPDESFALLEQERWASALRDEIRASLVEELKARYGVIDARTTLPGTTSDLRLEIDVARFESAPGREARLEGSWVLSSPATADRRNAVIRCDFSFSEPLEAGLPAVAVGHRRAVVRLANAVGDTIGAFRIAENPSCAAPTAKP